MLNIRLDIICDEIRSTSEKLGRSTVIPPHVYQNTGSHTSDCIIPLFCICVKLVEIESPLPYEASPARDIVSETFALIAFTESQFSDDNDKLLSSPRTTSG